MSSNRLFSRFSKSGKGTDTTESSAKSSSVSIFSSSRASLSKGSKKKGSESLQSVSEQKSLGLTVLAEGEGEIVVDIVALHGLNGHRERTWTAENDVFWLRDLLPKDIKNARIMSYGYNVDVFDKDGHGLDQQHVYDHARGLVGDLVLERELTDTSRRPIIFIAHSLGGIILKAALIHSDSCRTGSLEFHHSIAVSTHGILFMGTPHQGGSGVALARSLVNMASIFVKADSRILSDLERDSQLLHTQLGQYNAISSAYVTKFAYETLPTPTLFGNSIMVVPISSAVVPGAVDAEPIQINANHRDMVRFTGTDDAGYKKVQGHLRIMIKEAAKKTEEKWRVEDGKKRVVSGELKKTSIIHLKNISSTFFVGRKHELKLLHRHLTAPNDIAQRRCVIYGVGGAGKTELAVNYALQHTADFSAIFIVSAKDTQALRWDYADIARHLALPEALERGATGVVEDVAKQEAAISAVTKWFVDKEEGDWLLIIDNADDLEGVAVQEFIPPTRKGHVIMTSQNRSMASFAPPGASIEIEEMVQEDAETLFLGKAKIMEPSEEQKGICTEIVNRLGRLALAVEHAGAYVHDNDMALRLEDFLTDMDKSRQRVLDESPIFSNHKTSVLTTYSMTKQSLTASKKMGSLWLLTLVSFLDVSAVPESLLLSPDTTAYFTTQRVDYASDFHSAKKFLLSFSLIRIRKTDDGQTVISMHGLLQQCVQAKLVPKNQWIWATHAFWILWLQTRDGKFQKGHFIHLRYCLRWLHERHNHPEMAGKPEARMYMLTAFLMSSHYALWNQAGLMSELYELSCMCIQGLEKKKGNAEQVALSLAVVVKAGTVAFADAKMSAYTVLWDYFEQQMRPELLEIVKRIENGSASVSSFTKKARCLEDVFICVVGNPEVAPQIREFAEEAGKGCISRNQPELSELYFTIRRMPLNRTWRSMLAAWWLFLWTYLIASWTHTPTVKEVEDQMLTAARDRQAGNMDSTFALLRQIAKDKSEPLKRSRAVFDLVKLLVKAGKLDEAEGLMQGLMNDFAQITDQEKVKTYSDLYVWLRKTQSVLLLERGHEHHFAAKELLLNTLEETIRLFGRKSLSTLHASFLVKSFYEQSCCNDENIAQDYEKRTEEIFESVYATSSAMMRRGEGYRMGLILLMQGALQEADYVLHLAAKSAETLLGKNDELAREMKRMASVAQRELIEEKEEEKKGKVSNRWGSVTVWRDISGL